METLRARTRDLLALALAPLACDGRSPPPDPPASPSLVERADWERVDEIGEDVFGAERPEDLVCDELLGIGTEVFGSEEVLELNTDFCNYVTLRQDSLQPLQPGDAVAIRMYHYELTAPAPAQAHLALAIDGQLAWEQHVPSPAEGAFVEGEIAIDRALPAGTELQLHVHNHGANSYALLSLERVPPGDSGSAAP